MLTEIALTPQTFSPCTLQRDEWLRQIQALNRRIAQYGTTCPLVVANINSGSPHRTSVWRDEVRRYVGQATRSHQQALADLFRHLEPLLVARPSSGCVRQTQSEEHWAHEAQQAARPYPIDQIITTYAGHAAAQVCCARALHLHQLDQTTFWSTVTTNCFPTMNIADQIGRLRPFLLHGQRLIAVLPYGLEMERDWFFAFAEQALQRPADYPPPILELHVTWNGNYADMRAQQANHPAVQAFITAAQQWPTLRGQTLNVYVRQRSYRPSRSADQERFIARRLFVGEDAYEDPSLPPDVRIRWGLGIDHAAAWNDAQNQSEACFTLLPRALADRQFQHECRNVGPRLAEITFTC